MEERERRLARLFRAESLKSQTELSEDTELDRATIAHYESGRHTPPVEHLERMAGSAQLTVAAGEEVLELIDMLRQPRVRQGRGAEGLFAELGETQHARRAWQRLLRLRLPERPPAAEDRLQAQEQLALLKDLTEEQRLGAVRVAWHLQTWALCFEAVTESRCSASRDLEEAAGWARVALEIAERVHGPEGWRDRLKGAAIAAGANVLRVAGKIKAARADLDKANAIWRAGSDPGQILDPGLLLDLEASLCRDERRFEEALTRLTEALKVGRHPERYLIKKAFTLEVMGEYERAIEALLQAEPLLDRQNEPRLWYQHRFNLAVNYCHTGRYSEAAGLVQQVREVAASLEDKIFLIRVTWLEGRLAAGQGRTEEALRLLEQARSEFAAREMNYDVALAVLEIAALLLDEGRTAEVKALAPRLAEVFKSEGIHREAVAALKLFQKAVEREAATADLARRVLRFLFRARHDQGLRFSSR